MSEIPFVCKEIESSDIGNISKEEALTKIKIIKSKLKEYEIQLLSNESQSEFELENISNELKSTLDLISDSPDEAFNELVKSLDYYISTIKTRIDITENAIENYYANASIEKIRKKNFCEKFHLYRESVLSTLFNTDKNMRSLYFLILTLFSWFFLWTLITNFKSTGNIIDFQFWTSSLTGFQFVIKTWFIMFCYTLLVIPFVKLIEYEAGLADRIRILYFVIYFLYQMSLYVLSSLIIFSHKKISIASALILSCEVTRFSLKIHGYFREKLLYGLKQYHMDYASFSVKSDNDQTNINNANFDSQAFSKNEKKNFDNKKSRDKSQNEIEEEKILVNIKIHNFKAEIKKFLYYFFCPSLIYRDEYPRLKKHRLHFIVAHKINFVCCIIFIYILIRYICHPYFSYSKLLNYYSLGHFVFDSLSFAVPAVLFLVVGFFLFLHSWLNLWSELLLYGDRRFYEDWWNITNVEEYFRKWNMVVHEWLYYYIYNDAVRLSKGKLSRPHAKLLVFGISIVLHEVIVWQSFGIFFPLITIFFGPGFILTYIKTKQKKFNLVFWTELFWGMGIMLLLYLREFNLRSFFKENISLVHPLHNFIPRTLLMFMSPYKEKIITHFTEEQ